VSSDAHHDAAQRGGMFAALSSRIAALFAGSGQRSRPGPALEPASAPKPHRIAPTEIFTPTRPRAGRRALVGRQVELTRILEALLGESSHVVIYAERGRGKTSLANLAVERLRRSGVIIGRHSCDAASDFDQIMRGLLRDLPASLLPMGDDGDIAGEGCESILSAGNLNPADIAAIPARLSCGRLVFVIDEFDRVQDVATRTRLADTIKFLSDRGSKLLFMIVGVSSTLEDIIGQHPSIQRNLAAVHLPLLDDGAMEEMLVRGGAVAGVTFTAEAIAIIGNIARGMPYLAQLMGLRTVQETIKRDAESTSVADVSAAIDRLLMDAAPEVVARYARLTAGQNAKATEKALGAIAASPQDRWGRLPASAGDAAVMARLLDEKVLEISPGLPGSLQPLDRPLLYHVLLLTARNSLLLTASEMRPMALAGHS
jgi:hypothetical protein